MMSKLLHVFMGVAAAATLLLASSAQAAEEKVLNVYNWSDYIGEHTVEKFEKATGSKSITTFTIRTKRLRQNS
jgi:putrescine transport system substrate-binding protein